MRITRASAGHPVATALLVLLLSACTAEGPSVPTIVDDGAATSGATTSEAEEQTAGSEDATTELEERVAALETAAAAAAAEREDTARSVDGLTSSMADIDAALATLEEQLAALASGGGAGAGSLTVRTRSVELPDEMTSLRVECEPGERVTGGGVLLTGLGDGGSGTAYSVGHSSHPAEDGTAWVVRARGAAGDASPAVLYAVCLDV